MAVSSLHSTFTTSPLFLLSPKSTAAAAMSVTVRCGPRSNRRPLMKGRILSTEAIHAIQSLKRAHAKGSPSLDPTLLPNLGRLIKSDLIAILRELLRQDFCALALGVLSSVRSEYPDDRMDLNLYADVIFALSRNKMFDAIDDVAVDLEKAVEAGGVQLGGGDQRKGLGRVIRGVVEARRRESTVRIWGMVKKCGVGDTWTSGDEHVVKVLCRGLKGMGEVELASEVEREFRGVCRGSLGNKLAV